MTYMQIKVMDTFSNQARSGKDIQVIPWGKFNILSESYRRTWFEQYSKYENILVSGDVVNKV
ncbi:hypothetical protein HanPSC8_Chr03g0086611 [Helianthus annuus]|nr:hypothetical protein HanIR_Chr12g0614651 [Helianthus annuus]KAJ0941992.1 hypothetical protein HanPSC8_Chr03g0086611 [Helianthus annuus]